MKTASYSKENEIFIDEGDSVSVIDYDAVNAYETVLCTKMVEGDRLILN